MDKPKMHSPNFVEQNIEKLATLFPNCVTEAKNAQGELTKSIDFDLLKQELSSHLVEGPQERYQLNWPGKREALLSANAPISKTLLPQRDESIDFDSTKNLFIEGDNLDALKLMQETYLGKIKLIFIDPPYNTGSDFIYEDDFAENAEDYKIRSNEKDEEGLKLVANTDANGRFHSDWLSMMYSRLKLCRNMLKDDGAIFISIDDGEASNLRKIADEIFGDDCFVSSISWKKRSSPDARATIGSVHDTLLCYVKNNLQPKSAISKMPLSSSRKKAFTNPDNDPRGPWASVDMTGMTGRATKDQYFDVNLPSGRVIGPPEGRSWGIAPATFEKLRNDNRIWFGSSGDNVPRIKKFLSESDGQVIPSIWDSDETGSNDEATKEVLDLLESPKIFDTPKPTKLLKRIIKVTTSPSNEDIIMDFFCGSATTADATMQVNLEDTGNRRFIMVQIPEPCSEKSEAFKAGYKNISEVSKKRIFKAGQKIVEKNKDSKYIKELDIGYRALKVDSSNMAEVYYYPDTISQEDLFSQVDNVKEDRTEEDLLFQVMLDWGVDLTLPIQRETIQGKTVFYVDTNALVACFDKDEGIDEDFVKNLCEKEPLRVVFRDAGFANDDVKINVEQIFKQLSPHTEVKSI
ncbi:type III restriction-modification system methyltransferase [Oleiphilus messinensis]|uniref:site-specific DNA-methyltransferase (adenine-specific) n=1 Tax=Oleiphilus messinensis TaxID=141451 RepID=A0A1Y0IFD1_9GAMM|nr:site-specific DNA-methyltransferase [Oleiphilus messinensis]ARU58205.1 type III restriction-modification system methyltransferase [Oleiphilus messinensis]